MSAVRVRRLAGAAAIGALAATSCVDETHDLQVAALGGEAPGVPRGPLHRPGQPCLVCHGGEGPASTQFTMGGTVYAVQDEAPPAPDAQVTIEDIGGAVFSFTTNEAGNFYFTPRDWTPTYPVQVQVTQGSQPPAIMATHVNRDGSCADCHGLVPGPTSAGRVYAALAPLPDGGP